jgi:hypothetical protein
VIRSAADCQVKAKRSLSVIHSSLTSGSSPAGAEPVRRAGQRADRADLHGVAGEVRGEGGPGLVVLARAHRDVGAEEHAAGRQPVGVLDRLADAVAVGAREAQHVRVEAADLLHRAALLQVDERVARDLAGEPGAALAQDAPLAVQEDLGRDRQRPLDVDEPRLAPAVRHGLVLQGALAALVADRAVQRVVDEQQLHDAVLRLVRLGGGALRAHVHAGGGGQGAGRLGLRHLREVAVAARGPDLDEALPARAGRGEQRVVAEARDLDPELLGGADHQGALGHGGLDAVDGEGDAVLGGDGVRRLGGGDGHAWAPASWPVRRGV